MKILRRRSICILIALMVPLFVVCISFGSMLPEGLVMEETFKPGYGLPIGSVHLVQGEVVILHKGEMLGYWAKKDLPLFKGDTIVTKERGRIRLRLKDESVLTLASATKLVLTQSDYDPANKTRSTFINMALGKARFWAKKFSDFKHSKFNVKSPTAIIGVRGSEWVEEVTMDMTKVTALENTIIAVASIAVPEVEPTILEDFEQTIVEVGELPTEVVKISIEEIEHIKKDFIIIPEGVDAEVKVEKEKGRAEKKESAKEEVAVEETEEVLVSDQELVNPEAIEEPEVVVEAPTPEIIEAHEITEQVEDVEELQEDILEQVLESVGQINVSW